MLLKRSKWVKVLPKLRNNRSVALDPSESLNELSPKMGLKKISIDLAVKFIWFSHHSKILSDINLSQLCVRTGSPSGQKQVWYGFRPELGRTV